MKKLALIITAFLLLNIGCATVGPLNTPTGKPEIIINDASKKEICDAVINQMLSWDFQLQKQSESLLVFGKKDSRVSSAILLGSRYDAIPEWRFAYNIVDYSQGVRIVANISAVTNPGSAFERITDMSRNSQDAQNVQNFFERMKKYFSINAVLKDRGKIGIGCEKRIVKKVIENSPAQKAGIMVGDTILSIDGESPSDDDLQNLIRITGTPGSTVSLKIKRNEDVKTISVVRGNP